MKNILLYLFLIFNFSCQKHNESLKPKIKETEKIKDEDFEVFLDKFNSDSTFQTSRINFPIKTIQLDTENLKENTIEYNQSNYHLSKIDKQSKYYKIEKVIMSDSAKVYLKGIDNGIYIEFFFFKKNGIWKLDTWNDLST